MNCFATHLCFCLRLNARHSPGPSKCRSHHKQIEKQQMVLLSDWSNQNLNSKTMSDEKNARIHERIYPRRPCFAFDSASPQGRPQKWFKNSLRPKSRQEAPTLRLPLEY